MYLVLTVGQIMLQICIKVMLAAVTNRPPNLSGLTQQLSFCIYHSLIQIDRGVGSMQSFMDPGFFHLVAVLFSWF